jgi:hypothetical protein
MRTLILLALLLFFALVGEVQRSAAHEIFQEVLKEKYGLKSFACKTCHPDGDDRTIRTVFADLIADEMKDGNWAEKFKQAESEGDDAVKAFELLIADEFRKSVDQFGKRTLTVDQLMESALLTGVRLDPQKHQGKGDAAGLSSAMNNLLSLFATAIGGCLWIVWFFQLLPRR